MGPTFGFLALTFHAAIFLFDHFFVVALIVVAFLLVKKN